MPPAQPAADPEQVVRKQQLAQRWIAELGISEKAQAKWLARARKINKRYKKEFSDRDDAKRGFALLWSNTETIRPAVYARVPQPVVTRRFKDADAVGREASEILERALSYSVDQQDIDETFKNCTLDFVLIAKGQAWERYVPSYGDEIVPKIPVIQVSNDAGCHYEDEDGNEYDEADGAEGEYTVQGEPYRPVVYEESVTDYVNFEDFGHGVGRSWQEVPYVWRRVYMTRAELKDRFGDELGDRVPLDWGPRDKAGKSQEDETLTKKAAVYEIWDKATRKAIWISKSFNEAPLDERDDPLGLEDFFPCPRPLLGTRANDSLQPVADYVFYQDQAEEIDELTARIAQLQKALKVKGFYAASEKVNLDTLFKSDNNIMIPVPDWQGLKDDGGLRGKIEWFPIDQVMSALKACIDLRAQLLNDVYQITGIADIMRGSSDPGVTATAERIKGQWGPLRIRERQKEMARFCRDIVRIKGEVIAEKFSIDTLKLMSSVKLLTAAEKQQIEAEINQAQQVAQQQAQLAAQQAQASGQPPAQPPPPPEVPAEVQELLRKPTWEDVKALLEDNARRQFRIDIETDSTIEMDEAEEKAEVVEFIGAVSSLVQQWGPAVQARPELAPVAAELIKTGVRKFRVGRSVEDVIDNALDEMAKAPPQPQGEAPEPPDDTPVKVAMIDQQTAQMEQEAETQRHAADLSVQQQELLLKGRDQQLKLVSMNRDPTPQAVV